ncbi:MAG: hypothetical protein JWR20_2295, partial [Marmoricola sp.]|nr:hypothetical protein [Marmoricola sp.]
MAVADVRGNRAAATDPGAATGIVGATVRLSVVTDGGPRVDLVVPVWAEVSDVARSCADALGVTAVPLLRRTTGAALDPRLPLERAGVRHGSVLLAEWPDDDGPEGVEGASGAPDAPIPTDAVGLGGAPGWRRWSVTAAALAVTAAAAAGTTVPGAGPGSSSGTGSEGLLRSVAAAVL